MGTERQSKLVNPVDFVTEKGWLATIIEHAQAMGWVCAHFRPGMVSLVDRHGKPVWVTPVQADGKGFVDLILARERIVYIEAKSEAGKLSEAQEKWRDAILGAGGEWYCFRPSDWPSVLVTLE